MKKFSKGYSVYMPKSELAYVVKDSETSEEVKFSTKRELYEYFRTKTNADMKTVQTYVERMYPGDEPMMVTGKVIGTTIVMAEEDIML